MMNDVVFMQNVIQDVYSLINYKYFTQISILHTHLVFAARLGWGSGEGVGYM